MLQLAVLLLPLLLPNVLHDGEHLPDHATQESQKEDREEDEGAKEEGRHQDIAHLEGNIEDDGTEVSREDLKQEEECPPEGIEVCIPASCPVDGLIVDELIRFTACGAIDGAEWTFLVLYANGGEEFDTHHGVDVEGDPDDDDLLEYHWYADEDLDEEVFDIVEDLHTHHEHADNLEV